MANPGRPAVAAFDFDGTLTHGGSVWSFLRAVSGHNPVRAALAVLPGMAAAAVLGGTHVDRAKEALFVRTLQGIAVDEFEERSDRFGRDHYARRARADTAARFAAHRRAGHRLVIVSASPEVYLRPVARQLAADGLIATRLATNVGADGTSRMTGRYDGANCRGREKPARLRRWIADTMPGEDPFVWAYGNSRGDLPLLEDADRGVDVGRLGHLGALRGLPPLSRVGWPDPDDEEGG